MSFLSGIYVGVGNCGQEVERVAGKVRVHELAKYLGVTVKQLLLMLDEQGEFARSGSSTLPASVVRRLREAHAGHAGSPTHREGEKGSAGRQPKKPPRTPAEPKSWKCPNCLKRVDVEKGTALVQHLNARGQRCRGSGYQLPQKSTDALDHRVAGSFEGGRR